ncbi:MAG: peptidoglycan-binding domain-containing protein, partial [bacterium]|nr:peptidoglycan-binding domain-containing protein [bacterium]
KTKLFAIDEDTLAVGDVTTRSQEFSNNVAVDASGVIYSVDDDDKILYIVNTDGSDPTPVGTGTGITGRIPAAGFGPDGMLYVIEKIPSGGDQFLHVIDPDTGVATELAELDLEVNGGDLVVNGDMQVIYVHIDGEVWSIDLLDGYDEESLGFLPEDEQYTGLALIDDIYYATVRNEANGLQEFTLDGGFTDNGFSSFADHTVYAGDAASCPVEANDRNSISGWKFYDTENPIGEFAGGDSLLSDWPIRLYEDVLGDDWLFVESQDTDGNGEYSFENLEAKVYYVCELEVVDEGGDWVQTYPTSGDNVVDNDSPNQNEEADNCYRVNLGADEHVVDLYFGNYDGNVEEDNGGGGPVILGSGSSGGSSGGSVAGASTGPGGSVLGAATGPGQCTPWLYDFVNNTTDWKLVLRLQIFLNTFEGENLTLNGVYDEATADAVARFQLKYRTQVLAPWGLSLPTRFVWLTTTNMINSILNPNCRAALPAGPLVPYPGGFPAPETPAAIFSDGTFSPGETSGWAN